MNDLNLPGFPNTALKCSPKYKEQGVGLIEVLISLLILSIGLLGMAALQARGLTMTTESLQRTQATVLANDLIERARANRPNIADYAMPFANPLPTCDTSFSIDNSGVSENDLDEWQNNLACLLSSGNGQVVINGNVIQVTIQWQDRTEEDDEGNALIAGRNQITLQAEI
ncbi:MAG: type IV pilus modification protein PilV [Saccharospirillum sp.]